MNEEIGVLRDVTFGVGGYQDAMLGFNFHIGGSGWGVIEFRECGWISPTKEELEKNQPSYRWTHEDRIRQTGEKAWSVYELMKDAKVTEMSKLRGKPVRAYFNNDRRLIRFEILKEAIL